MALREKPHVENIQLHVSQTYDGIFLPMHAR